MGCGQPFLLGHSPPGLLSPPGLFSPPSERKPHLPTSGRHLIIPSPCCAAHTGTLRSGAALPAGSHLPVFPPTELIPGARHARSAALPTHACALSILSLLSSPLYSHLLHGAVNHAVLAGEGRASLFALLCRPSLHLIGSHLNMRFGNAVSCVQVI